MKHFFRFFALLLPLLSFAQPDTLWTRTYGGSSADVCWAMKECADGGFALAGYTQDSGSGDIFLVRTDAQGEALWSRSYGTPLDEYCYGLCQTSDGGFVLAGEVYLGPENFDGFVLRVNAEGDSIWSRVFGGANSDQWRSVALTVGGDLILAGSTFSFGVGSMDAWAVRTNSAGQVLWSHTYGGADADGAESICATNEGNFLIAGATTSFGQYGGDGWLVKINANGDSLWTHTYNHSGSEGFHCVLETADEAIVLAGSSESDCWLVKANNQGEYQWDRTYTSGQYSTDVSLAVASAFDGGFILVGQTDSTPPWMPGVDWTVKTNAEGDLIWSHSYGDLGNTLVAVHTIADGEYALAGFGPSSHDPICDYWLVRTVPDTGQLDGARTVPALLVWDFRNYPNPFNPSTTISFSLPRTSNVTLTVYDVTGRKVETLVDQSMNAGEHSVTFNGSALPSGLYFARLSAGEFMQTQKMVLLK